jgi:hypothetical protein
MADVTLPFNASKPHTGTHRRLPLGCAAQPARPCPRWAWS